jgi:oxygen-dependent protoporphyrinogen oxidase
VRIAVIGGGISGLTVAHGLVGRGHDVVLVDDGNEPGGLVASTRVDGFLCEQGPQALLDGAEEVRALIAGAGLESRLVRALPAARRRSVYVGGALRPVPTSPPALIKTSLLGARAKLRLLREPFVRRGGGEDESVFDFVARRFGAEAAARAAAPALIGIYAGDATALSAAAAFPRLVALEREHGSILRGMFRSRGGSRLGRPVSFPDGLAELPRALSAALGERRRAGRARALEPYAGGWRVALESGTLEVERTVLATPAAAAAALLAPHAPAAADALRAIPHAPVAVICLGFRGPASGALDLGMNLDSYGFVVARGEGIKLLGCQIESSVFPGRAPEGGVLLRALVGGTFDPALVDADDQTLATQVTGDLRRAAGLRRDPDLVRIFRARPGIPQYDRGHLARVRAVDDALVRLPGLRVVGHALRGVGLSACIQTATSTTRDIGA